MAIKIEDFHYKVFIVVELMYKNLFDIILG